MATKLPSTTTAEEARDALRALTRVFKKKGRARVRVQAEGDPGKVTVRLPREALDVLLDVLGQMANGNAVKIVSVHAELTTHEAADILNVSRPYLIGLLETARIPYRRVGTHRRIRFTDLMAYKRQDDARRGEALAALTRQSEDLGLGY